MKYRLRPKLNIRQVLSRPARGAWVEIDGIMNDWEARMVAPRKGRVG